MSAPMSSGDARRKLMAHARALHREAAGVVQIEMLQMQDIVELKDRKQYLECLMNWAMSFPTDGWLCMTCDHSWFSLAEAPPAAYAFVRAWEKPDPQYWLLLGFCPACYEHPELVQRVEAVIKQIWPDAYTLSLLHAMPEAKQ